MNAINVISPYRHLGMWVFDDPRVGLTQEPFVAGADTMIDRAVAGIPNAKQGFTLIFAASPIPARMAAVRRRRQLVLRPAVRHGGMAVSGAFPVLRGSPEGTFCRSQSA